MFFRRRPLLEQGFAYEGRRVPLVSAQGIFKPAVMDLPLSITTTPAVRTTISSQATMCCCTDIAATDPNHRDNVGLRRCMAGNAARSTSTDTSRISISRSGRSTSSVRVTTHLTFEVRADQILTRSTEARRRSPHTTASRRDRANLNTGADTQQRSVRQRLHQASFRERVLSAYSDHCALCQLKHRELLDAAHIVPDSEGMGITRSAQRPVPVQNPSLRRTTRTSLA